MKRNLLVALGLGLCIGLSPVIVPELGETTGMISSVMAEEESDFVIVDGYLYEYNGSDEEVIIPDGVTDIRMEAFSGKTFITKLVIPDSVKRIEQHAFYNCSNLVDLTLPISASYVINDSFPTFENCNAIEKLTYTKGNGSVVRQGLYIYCSETLKELVFEDGIKEIPERVAQGCTLLEKVTLPSNYTSVGGAAFFNCSGWTEEVVFPASLEKIETDAFRYSGIRGISGWTDNLKSIGYCTFEGCKGITEIVIPSGVKEILDHAFDGTGASKVVIPDSVEKMGWEAFANSSNLVDLTLPLSTVYVIYSLPTFNNCNGIEKLTYTKGNGTVASQNILAYCRGTLKELVFEEGIEEIPAYIATWCEKLEKITLPSSITSVGREAFCGSLGWNGKVVLPASLETIGDYAFKNTGINEIVMPDSIQNIGTKAFGDSMSLKSVFYAGTEESWKEKSFVCESDYFDAAVMHYNATGHTEETDQAVAATTTSRGLTEGSHCSVCGQVIVAQQEIPVLLSISEQPEDSLVLAGTAAKFTAAATGENLTYQWQTSTNGTTWRNSGYASAVKAKLTFTAKESQNGTYYRCKVTDGTGNTLVTDAVRLTVTKINITSQPADCSVTVGKAARFTVSATANEEGLTYQWQTSTDGTSWRNSGYVSAKKETLTFTSKESQNGTYYRCMITDSTGDTNYSDVVRLYVTKMAITLQPTDCIVLAGKVAKFTASAVCGDEEVSYQWQTSTDGVTWRNSGYVSATKATLTFTAKASQNGTYYRCKITDANGITLVTNVVKLAITKINITSQPADFTVTAGKVAKFTVAAAGEGLTYQWQTSTDGKTWRNSGYVSAVKATLTFTSKASQNGSYYRCVISNADGDQTVTDTVKLVVE